MFCPIPLMTTSPPPSLFLGRLFLLHYFIIFSFTIWIFYKKGWLSSCILFCDSSSLTLYFFRVQFHDILKDQYNNLDVVQNMAMMKNQVSEQFIFFLHSSCYLSFSALWVQPCPLPPPPNTRPAYTWMFYNTLKYS